MNAEMCSPRQAASMTNSTLVAELVRVAGQNNEYDCEDALRVLRAEVLRRLNAR